MTITSPGPRDADRTRADAALEASAPAAQPGPGAHRREPYVPDRVAVVLVHGMGEQRPLRSLRGLVDAFRASHGDQVRVLSSRQAERDYEVHSFIVPSHRTGGRDVPQVDFHEGYWAPLVEGSQLAHVRRWAWHLVRRRPWTVPARVQWLWYLVVVLALAGAAGLAWASTTWGEDPWYQTAAKVLGVAVLPAVGSWLTGSLGDAARYFDDHPRNVAVRTRVRASVVDLLNQLHGSGRYRRIIVVGHSLGGAVAFDALRLLWAQRMECYDVRDVDDQPAAIAAAALTEELGREHPGDVGTLRSDFDREQRRVFDLLRDVVDTKADPAWLVSDLITVGSPVAHPALLLTPPQTTLDALVEERELPACPPVLAYADAAPSGEAPPAPTFRFLRRPTAHQRSQIRFHHGAMFAATRWTNLYATGDFVGGPIRGDRHQKVDRWPAVHNIRFCVGASGDRAADGDMPAEDRRRVGPWAAFPVLSHSRYWRSSGLLRNQRGVAHFIGILDDAVLGHPDADGA